MYIYPYKYLENYRKGKVIPFLQYHRPRTSQDKS